MSAPAAPLGRALEVVGDRWSLQVIAALLDGPLRFGELQAAVEGIAPNVLSARLRVLEQEAVVLARPYSQRPPRVEYELSASGRELAGALRLLADWGARGDPDVEAPRHALCGTELEAIWWCESCRRRVAGPDEVDGLHEL